jgi:GNAT superfamily N-acetyltransferase
VIRDLSSRDLPRIRELLSRANDIPYDLERVSDEKCFGEGYEGQPQTRVFGDFEGIAVTCGKYLRILAVDRERRRRGVGSALLQDAESLGARIVAAEPGNYFTPGVLESMVPFFTKRGFHETARTHNLFVDELPSGVPNGFVHERDRVLDFIEQHFGPIWRFEASRGATIFSIEHEGRIAGFSTHEANNRGLGSFGPIGVAEKLRGHGFGRQLLLASLGDLKRLGYHRAVIPWTDAIEYYRKICGAKIAHRFVVVRKDGA